MIVQIGTGTLEIYEDGRCSLCGGKRAPFAHIVSNGRVLPATGIVFGDGAFTVCFDGVRQQVEVSAGQRYCRFRALDADPSIEAFIWGPFLAEYPGECGEVLGVERKDGQAVGIQALNPKTVGGFPKELVPSHPMAEQIINRKGMREPVSACAALPLHGGAALQAYCRNRTRIAYRDFFYAKDALVLPAEGEEALIAGSAVALFACPEEEILPVISEIELAEGLPHTLVDGEWAKTARRANASYLIMDFDEKSLDEALDCAEMGGFSCLYHPGFFKNWGHFEVEGGDDAVKAAVERAKARGIDLGVHTLSNFMTTNDPYVTPIPHPNLLKMGETTLCADIGETDTEIAIAKDDYFTRLSTLNAVRIGDELVHYKRIRREGTQVFLSDCERGAWGTVPAAHKAGENAARLWDYDYRTLFPDLKLQQEFSRRLGEFFRYTGLKRMSFDGLACDYTGHEEYAQAKFVKEAYDVWGPEVMSDASGLTHYNWHMHSYMNWGEPWYADMRNGMFDYRRSNQEYFRRNLMPPMMGWYTLRGATRKYESTTPDDINWMLSKAAGYGAGFAFNMGKDALRTHGKTKEYLSLISAWEKMRMYGDIPESLKEQLRDPKTEWDIEEVPGGFHVYRMNIAAFECSPEGAQPGMPSGGDWMTFNPYPAQKMVFRMRAGDERDRGGFSQLTFRAGEDFIRFDLRLDCGQYLIYDGGVTAEIRDKDFHLIRTVEGDGSPLKLEQGISMLLFKCVFDGEEPPYPQVKIFMRDQPVFVPFRKD